MAALLTAWQDPRPRLTVATTSRLLVDAEEGSRGGRKGFIGVQMGLLASNPVITGVGDRLRSVESPIWSRRGRRKGKETDRWGQCGSETGREGKHRWAGPYCQSERR